jgi:hypothetical protein
MPAAVATAALEAVVLEARAVATMVRAHPAADTVEATPVEMAAAMVVAMAEASANHPGPAPAAQA